MLENKLGIMDSAELAREEERLSKKRAKELFEKDLLAGEPAGMRRLPTLTRCRSRISMRSLKNMWR